MFPFSAAYFTCKGVDAFWKKSDLKKFYKNIQSNQPLDIPAETLKLSWQPGLFPYLCIEVGFRITEQNADKVLTAKAMSKVLPYIFSSVQNISHTNISCTSKNAM